jgi:type I restriction enzyme S subunit
MVRATPRKTAARAPSALLRKFSTSIMLSEVMQEGVRFEAGAFNIEARHAVEQMRAAGLSLVPLYGNSGLATFASKPTRFPRVYVDATHGTPFLSSSDIISMRPEIENYLSLKLTSHLAQLLIREWDVLISRSGTVGNVGLASERLSGCALSEHAIRLRAPQPEDSGFIAAFLRSRYGRLQLIHASYGSVVQHIEPEHLSKILVPDLPPQIRQRIGKAVMDATRARNDSNKLLDEADTKLHGLLKLPTLSSVSAQGKGSPSVKLKASRLGWRFDASFHDPVTQAATDVLQKSGLDISRLGSPAVTSEIRPITKFRKRLYVPSGGILLMSSKQLMQIDPVDVKRLAKGAHTKDLIEIALRQNMVTISRSGTIGRVQIIPAYMEGWAASEHATRIISAQGMNPGYIYAWLSSDYGQRLVKRYSYGSVILEIDKEMLESVPIPVPSPQIRNSIGDLVLRANELRDHAWRIEREAIEELEGIIESGAQPSWHPIQGDMS